MLRLLTLGGLSLVDGGVPVTGAASQRSRLALLAALAAAGPAGVSRDKLLALLWPESDNERARHALKQGVYALRRDLGNENAIAGTATLSLDSTVVSSDIREFDDAIARGDDAAALALYAGPFLDGVFIKAAPEFDQWSASERSRLERAHLDAIGRLARAAEADGDVVMTVQWWRRAAAAEPLSGRIALSLMRALADSGDVSAAIQHARVHDAMVRGELDSPADDAVLALAEEIRCGDYTPRVRVTSRTSGQSDSRTVQPEVDVLPEKEVAEAPDPFHVGIAAAAVTAVADARRADPVEPAKTRSPWRQRALATLVVLLGLALAATLVPGLRTRASAIFPGVREARSGRRIVVATFDNRTGDRSLDPLGELASDWLARTLLEADFEVVDSRTSATIARMLARITPTSTAHDRAAALAARTGAATVVTGSFYRQGDSLQFEAHILDPVRGVILYAVGPIRGPVSAATTTVGLLANRVTAAMAASSDSTAGASAASLVEPPSVEAFEHTSRAWEMFFARPSDTTAVFAELARASAVDTAYTAPLLMRGYVLDVKGQWRALADVVKALEPRRARMGRTEREVLALFESDLRGDLLGRLRASREMLRLSPGSADVALLVAVSASYLNRAAEANAVLRAASPDRGINLVSPMYWAWRAASEHALGRYDDELASAIQQSRRFPASEMTAMAFARAYAARGSVRALDSLLARAGMNSPAPLAGTQGLALLAARELRVHGHEGEAAKLFARVASLSPPRSATREVLEQHALALYESGNVAGARALYSSLLSANAENIEALGRLGAIAARSGDSTAARRVDQRLSEWRSPYGFGQPSYWRAHIAALSGRGSDAVSLLHAAIAAGFRPMDLGAVTLHEEGDFAALWKDAGFRELVRPRDGAAIIP